ncbi:hypothetical protein HYALB_00008978 [Hymenoscyphus albidus]|uniref:Uncharacterized protein n=1 Tax=Hymenoscyphus albidus TaxID=595503 RepID=A0A9N9LSM6_9HELO|nr:hypothetical protein HYALB_00008978 [Hymenoscyphus albidus]
MLGKMPPPPQPSQSPLPPPPPGSEAFASPYQLVREKELLLQEKRDRLAALREGELRIKALRAAVQMGEAVLQLSPERARVFLQQAAPILNALLVNGMGPGDHRPGTSQLVAQGPAPFPPARAQQDRAEYPASAPVAPSPFASAVPTPPARRPWHRAIQPKPPYQ